MSVRPSRWLLALALVAGVALTPARSDAGHHGGRTGVHATRAPKGGSWWSRRPRWLGGTGKLHGGHGAPSETHAVPTGKRRFASRFHIPPPREGTVRVYRGTAAPDLVQVSRSMRGKPIEQVPSGGQHFLDAHEGRRHDGNSSDDGVSVTTDLFTAELAGPSVLVYDVPREVFERLPTGAVALAEKVFKFSIPDAYLVGVFDDTFRSRAIKAKQAGGDDLHLHRVGD
jgi:hypothetical protein